MKPTIEDLEGPRFTRIASLRHVDLVDFAAEYYWRRASWFSRIHHAISIAMLALLVLVAWQTWRGFDAFMMQFGLAFVAFIIPVLPLHEALHAIGYRIAGARNLRWSWTSRGLAVYVMAHREVVAAAPFAFVALVPFLVINLAVFFAAALWPSAAVLFVTLALFHHSGTSGDWALLHFLVRNASSRVYTFDDCETGETFFYAENDHDPRRAGLPASVGSAGAMTRLFLAGVWTFAAVASLAGGFLAAPQSPAAALLAALVLIPFSLAGFAGAVYVAFPRSAFGEWLDVVLPAIRRPAVAAMVAFCMVASASLLLLAEWSLRQSRFF